MSADTSPPGRICRRIAKPANDNAKPRRPMRAIVRLPVNMAVQIVEIEVLAQLLDALPANDNEDHSP